MEAIIIRKTKPCKNVPLKPAFNQKPGISEAKNLTLCDLLTRIKYQEFTKRFMTVFKIETTLESNLI